MAIQHIFNAAGEENAPALGQRFGLHDICAYLALFDVFVVLSKLMELHGEHPGLGEEVIVAGEFLLHGHKMQP